jgi:hypothetical protein
MAKFGIGAAALMVRERGEEGDDGTPGWAAVVGRLNGEEMVQPALDPSVGGSMPTISGGFSLQDPN